MKDETSEQRTDRILKELKAKYPEAKTFDLDGRGMHFVSEVEPTKDHPEYDRAIEVIIQSRPHKHLKMTQNYTILSGTLELHVDDEIIHLQKGDEYTVTPGKVHWAVSKDECWLKIYSRPGWTAEDHIVVDLTKD